jgi:hypothetical protein
MKMVWPAYHPPTPSLPGWEEDEDEEDEDDGGKVARFGEASIMFQLNEINFV